MNKRVIMISAGAAAAVSVILGTYLFKKSVPTNTDLTSIHVVPTETQSLVSETTAAEKSTTEASTEHKTSSISSSLEKYEDGQISVEYPVISNMSDAQKENEINKHLKENALALVSVDELDGAKDQLQIKCKVINFDRKKIIVVYSGTIFMYGDEYEKNIFYTNTVDLNTISDIGFHDYTDARTMAEYFLSNECEYLNASDNIQKAVNDYKKDYTIDEIADLLNQADFPLQAIDNVPIFPDSFSYSFEDYIYFSLPVPHSAGDYIIIKYKIQTK